VNVVAVQQCITTVSDAALKDYSHRRESWQAARRIEQIAAGGVPLKYMHGHGRSARDRAVYMGVREATPGAVLDADLRPDRVRVQFDDDEVLDEAIVTIGRTGYLVREGAVHEPFDEQRIRAVGVDNVGPLRARHDVEEVLHVSRTAAVPFAFA
jgi:hypothetical protein